MRRTTIFHSDKYDLVSYGNGISYALHDNANKRSLFLQGDDAIEFEGELKSWEKNFPCLSYDQIMSELCDEYCYVMVRQ